ncbi:MAG: hypothetical protein J6M05_03815 [Cardiobacteriaceae bacterium]|nr:hypothetical protein [Cardiobacteriaceae bacterium]
MRKFLFIFLFIPILALCDLEIQLVDEYFLPYQYSPSNYNNSSMNYANSSINYANSSTNYANSETNYKNSSTNYQNSIRGNHRLVYDNSFAGYYVENGSGLINFFSANGKRMFYMPKGTVAVFDSDVGKFSGVVAQGDYGRYYLFLTEYGFNVLSQKQ